MNALTGHRKKAMSPLGGRAACRNSAGPQGVAAASSAENVEASLLGARAFGDGSQRGCSVDGCVAGVSSGGELAPSCRVWSSECCPTRADLTFHTQKKGVSYAMVCVVAAFEEERKRGCV